MMSRKNLLSQRWPSPQILSHTILGRRRYHLTRTLLQSIASPAQPQPQQARSPSYIPAPAQDSGPLLTRQPNRELPSLAKSRRWLKTLPIFVALIAASALAIFNYQKSSSSTLNSILYALRTNERSRQMLGDEVYFASKVPWIAGELNQLHGRIDIRFWVKGSMGQGKVRFVSVRRRRNGLFETLEWSLEKDGRVVDLLDHTDDGQDPFQKRPNTE